jgi:MYXO-CTERM domain-containing protein
MCSTQPGNETGNLGWLLGSALAALATWRQRRAA